MLNLNIPTFSELGPIQKKISLYKVVLFLIRSCEFCCTFVSLFFEFKSSLKIFSAHSTFPQTLMTLDMHHFIICGVL